MPLKKKNPTYLPTVKNMSRVTANIQFFKDGPGAIILTNLLLFYVRMLSCKIQLFWLDSF
jgi:hypothetical protein